MTSTLSGCRFFERPSGCTLFLLVPVLLGSCAALRETEQPPNLVIFLADDLGWNDVGFQGSQIQTPNIDRLAAEGLRLERFYTFPSCSPARVALMTGRSPNRMGIGDPIGPGRPKPPLDEHFFPESLQHAGYQTWLVGKWHLGGSEDPQYRPQRRGFDQFYGHLGGGIDYYQHTHFRRRTADWYRNEQPIQEEGYSTDLLTAEARRRLQGRDKSRPFFLYLSFNAPHIPLQAPEGSTEKYEAIFDTERRTYAAMTEAMDTAIGKVLATLDEEGLRDNTLVLFVSDNGGNEEFGGADNGPFRGEKHTFFEGGTRVPATMRWTGVLPAGRSSEQVVSMMDWFPTLLAALQVTPGNNKPLDGRNVWPQLLGRQANLPPEGMVMAQSREQGAVWDGPWKMVQQPGRKLLFRIQEDPLEKKDLSAQQPGIVDELTSCFREMTQYMQ